MKTFWMLKHIEHTFGKGKKKRKLKKRERKNEHQ